MVLTYLVWRSAEMENALRAAELERAHALTEKLLQRAPTSRAAFAAVPSELRATLGVDGAIDATDVGWVTQQGSPIDEDLVVDDRIDRATRSEFVDQDAAAAQGAFTELLAVPLLTAVRLRALVAAAWQSKRAGLTERVVALRRELDAQLVALSPADLGRPAVAQVVAAAMRLAAAGKPPVWADTLVPFLPPDLFASLPGAAPWQPAHDTLRRRRALLSTIAEAWKAQPRATDAGLLAVDPTRLLWWLPGNGGGHDVALLTPVEWCECVQRAGHEGALPEVPSPFGLLPATATSVEFAGVPGIRGIANVRTTWSEPLWMRPTLTAGLLALLGLAVTLAVVLQLRAARREVQAVRTQSEFLTTVTHELKTPLAAIRLLGEMLVDGRARGREADYYRMLAGEAGRLSMLIENVLDLGRLERGERAYDLRAVDVGEVLGETLAMFAPLAERDGAKVVWDDLLGSVAVHVDRGALVQALIAVLDNARKYAAVGARIDVVTRRHDDQVAIDVRDHGPGVPPLERERIFERFVRGSAHAHGSTPGVGIGLYLARSIVRRLAGDLVCTDPVDGGPGACFTFLLPTETCA